LDLQSMIVDAGGEVLGIAAKASDAEQLAQALRPDIILMDVRLRGERDGIASAHAIRTLLDAPIIFVTGNEDPDTVARIRAASGGLPVHKPVHPRALIDAVLVALNRGQRH
jgi:AmiR/NasT family two-component response regulator